MMEKVRGEIIISVGIKSKQNFVFCRRKEKIRKVSADTAANKTQGLLHDGVIKI